MFKRYEHCGHVLLHFHSVTDIQVLPIPIQPKTFRFPNVFSTLRSMNREGFSRRISTVGPGFISMKLKISRYANLLRKGSLDEAFCILKVTGVLIEKTLMYIFSKIQFFEVQPCADPESYVRGWWADNGPTLNAGLVAL